jgi:hypothetical protein
MLFGRRRAKLDRRATSFHAIMPLLPGQPLVARLVAPEDGRVLMRRRERSLHAEVEQRLR